MVNFQSVEYERVAVFFEDGIFVRPKSIHFLTRYRIHVELTHVADFTGRVFQAASVLVFPFELINPHHLQLHQALQAVLI